MRGATPPQGARLENSSNFNPRAPCGARPGRIIMTPEINAFQSTRPMRGATLANSKGIPLDIFQSTRPMRGATEGFYQSQASFRISIHAPHAGRDLVSTFIGFILHNFNPRAPCGARPLLLRPFIGLLLFQSTRPMRGATWRYPMRGGGTHHFNPRAPCGARLSAQIIALTWPRFQSTRPMRGATETGLTDSIQDIISIHAPHAGRDQFGLSNGGFLLHFNPRAPCGARPGGRLTQASRLDFNPRAPCGARLYALGHDDLPLLFQSTRPMRGATLSIVLQRSR